MSFGGFRPSYSFGASVFTSTAPSTSTFDATPTQHHSNGGGGLFGTSSAAPRPSGLFGSSHKCGVFGCSGKDCAKGSGRAGPEGPEGAASTAPQGRCPHFGGSRERCFWCSRQDALEGAAPTAPQGATTDASVSSASTTARGKPPVGFGYSSGIQPAAERPSVQSGSRDLFGGASIVADPSQKPRLELSLEQFPVFVKFAQAFEVPPDEVEAWLLSRGPTSAPPASKPAHIPTNAPVESAKDTKTAFTAYEAEMLRLTRDTNDQLKGVAEQLKRALEGAAAKPLQHDASSSSATVDKLVDVLHALSSTSKVALDPVVVEQKIKDPVVEPVSNTKPNEVHSKPLQFGADRLGASVVDAAVPLSESYHAADILSQETLPPKDVEPVVVLESLPSSSAASSAASATTTESAPSPLSLAGGTASCSAAESRHKLNLAHVDIFGPVVAEMKEKIRVADEKAARKARGEQVYKSKALEENDEMYASHIRSVLPKMEAYLAMIKEDLAKAEAELAQDKTELAK
ncbi:hypothetical protein JCM6882_005293 [Rhodosporidiobolus microsporus]